MHNTQRDQTVVADNPEKSPHTNSSGIDLERAYMVLIRAYARSIGGSAIDQATTRNSPQTVGIAQSSSNRSNDKENPHDPPSV